MMKLRWVLLSVSAVTLPGVVLARPPLQVDYVASFPQMSSFSNLQHATLGNQELFIFGTGAGSTLYRFDGHSAAAINDPYAGQQPSFRTYTELNGDLYYTANSPGGESLYKTDGLSTQFVVDVNPATTFDPQIREMYTADNYVFMRSAGPSGTELFRTDGTVTTEYDLLPGPMNSNPSSFIRHGNELLFTAGDTNGFRTMYRIHNGVPEPLGQVGFDNNQFEFEGSLYWMSGGKLYKYDSGTVSPILETSGLVLTNLAGINSQYFVFTARDTATQKTNTYTWDGANVREVLQNPVTSLRGQAIGSQQYFVTDQGSLFKINLTNAVEVPGTPGNSTLGIDGGTPTRLNDQIIFKSVGPLGSELYRLDDNVATLIDDINPTGDAFAFSTFLQSPISGELYFTAWSPGGRGLYRTDGFIISMVAEIGTGDPGTQQYPGLPLAFYSNYPGSMSPAVLSVADANSVAEFASYFASPADGFPAGRIVQLSGATFYFAQTGNIFSLSVVPEPNVCTLGLIAATIAMGYRGRVVSRRDCNSDRLAAK